MKQWYCIYTKPKQEDAVSRKLSQLLELEVLNPKFKRKKYVRQRLTEVEEELFPSYIFSRLDPYQHTHLIKYTRGVRRFVGDSSGCPYIVDESIIEFLQSKMNEGYFSLERHNFTKGERIEIKDGPFIGLEGFFVEELKANERVLILINTLQHGARVELDKDFIAARS
jgi:transcription elongation factor/antiterminator RfaH